MEPFRKSRSWAPVALVASCLAPILTTIVTATLAPSLATAAEEAPPGELERAGTVQERAAPTPSVFDHPTPRIKLSYQRFSAGNVDGTSVPLEALHLDMYPLSFGVVRVGWEVEGGRGDARYAGVTAATKYGLLGLNAGLQWPGRVTPFLEGRLAGGVLSAKVDGTITIPGTTVMRNGLSAATWMYARGLDAGVEVYAIGRAYVSLSLGWIRTTWGSADYAAMVADARASLSFKNVTHDSLLFKIGLGI